MIPISDGACPSSTKHSSCVQALEGAASGQFHGPARFQLPPKEKACLRAVPPPLLPSQPPPEPSCLHLIEDFSDLCASGAEVSLEVFQDIKEHREDETAGHVTCVIPKVCLMEEGAEKGPRSRPCCMPPGLGRGQAPGSQLRRTKVSFRKG